MGIGLPDGDGGIKEIRNTICLPANLSLRGRIVRRRKTVKCPSVRRFFSIPLTDSSIGGRRGFAAEVGRGPQQISIDSYCCRATLGSRNFWSDCKEVRHTCTLTWRAWSAGYLSWVHMTCTLATARSLTALLSLLLSLLLVVVACLSRTS